MTPPPPAVPCCASCYFWWQRPTDGRMVCTNAAAIYHGEPRASGDGCAKHDATPRRRRGET